MYKNPPIKCLNQFAVFADAAILGIFHDLVIIIAPIPTLWQLNLATIKKLNLLVMFSLGVFVIICSTIRLPTLLVLHKSSDPSCKL
jgi:hypothetical protein